MAFTPLTFGALLKLGTTFHLSALALFCLSSTLTAEGSLEPERTLQNNTEKPNCETEPSKEAEKESANSCDPDKKNTEDKAAEKPPEIGNLSLPASQQPSGLYGFGGNIIDKGEVQVYLFADGYFGRKKIETDLLPYVLFGITESFSVLFTFPYSPYNQDDKNKSCGLKDCFVQLEYAFYNKSTYSYVDQATLVGNITVPTGSSKKNPHTGFGSTSFFIGATYSRTTPDWLVFAAPGAMLTTSEHGTKFGDFFLYQLGFGKNMPSPPGWIYAWILEFDGQYTKKDRIKGVTDKNSGGNSIFVTPSIWISSREMLLQFGVSLPINQNLFGKQNKFDWGFNFNFAWSFY